MRKDDCIFCKIANGEIPSATLYEDEEFRVVLDLGPAAKGHALILPKDHYADLYEIDEEVAGRVFKLAKKMATKMTEALGCDGFNIVIKTDTGDVKGSFASPKNVIASSDTGSVRVPSDHSGERCEITTDTGDIRITISQS